MQWTHMKAIETNAARIEIGRYPMCEEGGETSRQGGAMPVKDSVTRSLESSRLAKQEPEFFRIWLADQYPGDPQIERWCEIESNQIATGEAGVAEFLKYFPVDGKRVLDIGCQWGATCIALAMAGAAVYGVDVRDEFIRGARIRATHWGVEVHYETSPAEALPFDNASFDVVICNNVLEHVKSYRRTIKEIARVLRPGGRVYLNGPNRLSLRSFCADPHYLMVGVSILPHWLGEYYVRSIRHRPAYDVGVFPIASRVERFLKKNAIEVVESSRQKGLSSGIGGKRRAVQRTASAWLSRAKFNVSAMFWFVGQHQ